MDTPAWQTRLDSLYNGTPTEPSQSTDLTASVPEQQEDLAPWQKKINSLYSGESQKDVVPSTPVATSVPTPPQTTALDTAKSIPTQSAKGFWSIPEGIFDLSLNSIEEDQKSDKFEYDIKHGSGSYDDAKKKAEAENRPIADFYNHNTPEITPKRRYIPFTQESFDNVYEWVTGRKPYVAESDEGKAVQFISSLLNPGSALKAASLTPKLASKIPAFMADIAKQLPAAGAIYGSTSALQSAGVTNEHANLAAAIAAAAGMHKVQGSIAKSIANPKPKITEPINAEPAQLQNELTVAKEADLARTEAALNNATNEAAKTIKLDKDTPIIGDEARSVVAPFEDAARKDYKTDYTKAGNPDVSFDTKFMKQNAAKIKDDFLRTNPGQEKSAFANKLDEIIKLPDVAGLNQLDTINQVKKDIFTEIPMQYKVLENGVEGGTWRNGAVINMFDSIAPNLEKQAIGNGIRGDISGEINATRKSVDGSNIAGGANEVRATAETNSPRANLQQSEGIGKPNVDAGVEGIPKTIAENTVPTVVKKIDESAPKTKAIPPESEPREFERPVNLDDVKAFEQARFKYGEYSDAYKKGWTSKLIAKDNMSPEKIKPYKEDNAGLAVERFTRPGQSGAENVKSFLEATKNSPEAATIAGDMIADHISRKNITTEKDFNKFKREYAPALEALPQEARARFDKYSDALAEAEGAKVRHLENTNFYNEKLVKDAIGGKIEELPTKIYQQVFNTADSKPIGNLLNKIKDNEQAMQGARSSLARGIAEKLNEKNGFADMESAMKNKNNLDKILTPDQVNALRILLKDNKPSKITEFFTTFDETKTAKLLEKGGIFGVAGGALAAPKAAAIYSAVKLLGEGSRKIDSVIDARKMRLMEQAILNPELAKALAKYDANKVGTALPLAKAIQKSMVPATIGVNANRGNEDYIDEGGFRILDENGKPIKRKNYKNGGVVQ